MPVTRSAASPSKAKRQSNQLPHSRKKPIRTYLDLLSSDEDEGPSSSKGKRRARTIRAESPVVGGEDSGCMNEVKLLITMLAKDNENLTKKHHELTAMVDAHEVAEGNLNAAADESAAAALGSLKELAECPICGSIMKAPTLLPCTHVFCERCLADWFENILRIYKLTPRAWGPLSCWKKNFMELMGGAPITPYRQRYLVRTLGEDWHLTTGPEYSCPTCRERVSGLPVLCHPLAAVSDHLAAATNEEQGPIVEAAAPEEEDDEDPEVQEVRAIEDVFYEQKVKEMSTKNVWAAFFAGWALPEAPEPVPGDADYFKF
ncbi:hypothetical protein BC629DRAFT_929160 [Irpex lacteus]|nr:hypothetical protein BC629DRAFT_929160 [Irpex lacteus]